MEVDSETNKKRKLEEDLSQVEDDDDFVYVSGLSVHELKELLKERQVDCTGIVEKEELIQKAREQLKKDRDEGIYRRKKTLTRRDCPYLDTIKRELLDFDFEKLCSVTLQNLNVYACLVCGKYFQGRGRKSPAYLHSLQANHHVFINLHNEKVYCLPDDYEVIDPSLSDIKYLLNPTYTTEQMNKLDKEKKTVLALVDGAEYLPGFVGLNNIKLTDWFNSVMQSFLRVAPFRNYFMLEQNYAAKTKDPVVLRFGELVRKMYNPRNFKAHVDPHELLQTISTVSSKRFQIGQQSDPIEFVQFFLNTVHKGLGGTKKLGSSIVHQVFQGQVEVTTLPKEEDSNATKVDQVPFLYLTLDLPPTPLFKDELETNIIPQIPIFNLLSKFNGVTEKHIPTTGERKTFRILKLPTYLIVHIQRFAKNNFFVEKNPTIVTSPLKGLDLKEYLKDAANYKGSTRYDLVANIVHEGEPTKGNYRAHVLNKAADQWYEIQDLIVKEILPQLIVLSESYIQVYERRD